MPRVPACPQPAGAVTPPKSAESKAESKEPAPWPAEKLQQLQESGEVIEAPIVSVNKGGAKIRVEGVSGFIPFRRLGATRIKAGEEDMSYLVGQTVRAKIVEVSRCFGVGQGAQGWSRSSLRYRHHGCLNALQMLAAPGSPAPAALGWHQ